MSERNRGSNVAAGVGVGLLLLVGLFILLYQPPEPEHGQGEAERDAQQTLGDNRNAGSAIVGSGQTLPSHPQPDRKEWREEQDLKAQWHQADFARKAIFVAFLGVIVTGAGLLLVWQTLETNKGAVAQATEANKISRDALIASERPWVAVEFKPGGPLTFDNGGAQITITFRVRNTGKSPARRIWIDPTIHVFDLDGPHDFTAMQRAKLEQLKSRKLELGFTLFPDERVAQDYKLSVEKEKIDRIIAEPLNGLLFLVVYGAVAYRFVGDETIHLTSFSFDVKREGISRVTAKPKRALDAIFIDEGTVNVNELRFHRSFLGIEHAD